MSNEQASLKKRKTGSLIALLAVLAVILLLSGGVVGHLLFAAPQTNHAADDPIYGRNWSVSNGSNLVLDTDGTFFWFQDATNTDDYYYSGTYEVYLDEYATDYIIGHSSEYGITQEELTRITGTSNEGDIQLCCLILTNEEMVIAGNNELSSPTVIPCYGFYNSESDQLSLVNVITGEAWNLAAANSNN